MSRLIPDRIRILAATGLFLATSLQADHLVGSVAAALSPQDVKVTYDSRYFFVSLAGGNSTFPGGYGTRMLKYDAATLQLAGSAVYNRFLTMMALRPSVPDAVPPVPQDRLYVLSTTDSEVQVFSTAPAYLRSIPLGCTPRDVNFDPSGNLAYVSCSAPARLKVIDVLTEQVVRTINLDGTPCFLR